MLAVVTWLPEVLEKARQTGLRLDAEGSHKAESRDVEARNRFLARSPIAQSTNGKRSSR
jgi:hypothetical protein